MKVLVIGGGAREQAIAWKLLQDLRVRKVYLAPGNGGSKSIGVENVTISATDVEGLLTWAEKNLIDLTVVGPEGPLALDIVRRFQQHGLRIFGPSYNAFMLTEGSKSSAKAVMSVAKVPTARYATFYHCNDALAYIRTHGLPIVVKADGLAAGKGAYVCTNFNEVEIALDDIMVRRLYKTAGDIVVVEDCLTGQEISTHYFCDGANFVSCPSSQDHKRQLDGDEGPNTGGMGAIAPVPWVSPAMMKDVDERVAGRILGELSRIGHPFVGCLYPGLMTTPFPNVLEFNARMGDPETQVLLRLLKTSLLDIFSACIDGTVASLKVEWYPGFAVCIVMASGGYPNSYKKGFSITGIPEAEQIPGVKVFHAGTVLDSGVLRTDGGRVLGVTEVSSSLCEALATAYHAIEFIKFEGAQYRKDIGTKSLAPAESKCVP